MTTNPFQKATRAQAKARVAFEGPTGAGKTWTALEWATVLADGGGRIAVVDTERGSASLYSAHFDFDVVAMAPPYEPAKLAELLKTAEGHGYAAVVIDSLSHFWEGEGGTLDMVDAAASRSGGNSFAGWKIGTPALRHLVDTMLGLDAHLIATMRSKMEYVLEENERGKKVPRKVGLAPVMRAGVEYEFTLVGDLDLEHRLTISKSRCDLLADEMIQPGRAAEAAQRFKAWLAEGEPLAARADIEALVSRLNALAEAVRPAAKSEFVTRFGMPDALRAAQLDAAAAFITEIEAGPATRGELPGEGEPASGDQPVGGDPPAEAEEPPDVNGPSSAEGPPPAPPEPEPVKTRFHRLIGEAAAKWGVSERDLRHLVVLKATGGATNNSQQATAEALEEACGTLASLVDGRAEVRVRVPDGDLEYVPQVAA